MLVLRFIRWFLKAKSIDCKKSHSENITIYVYIDKAEFKMPSSTFTNILKTMIYLDNNMNFEHYFLME